MRTISATQDRVLSLRNRSTHVRVKVEDSTGDFQDVTNLRGRDFFESAVFGQGVDKPVATATVTFFREIYKLSLAPLVGASALNQPDSLLEVSRGLKIETAVLGKDQQPSDGDFELMFEGHIDSIDWGGTESVITVQCRDLGGELQDEFIENQKRYGDGVKQLDAVIQDILDDNVSGTPPVLLTATAPAFVINEYLQQKQPIMQAIRVLGQLIGYDVRYRFDSGGGDFRLTLIEPDRSKTVPDRTFSADDYDDLTNVAISRVNIRNFIRVVIDVVDDSDPDSPGQGVRTQVIAQDAASIARYGRRFMEIAEAGSSPIDSVVEAQRMADAALGDLKEPNVDHSSSQDYFWPVQLGDLYRFTANGIHYDVDQDLAVVGFTHTLTRESAKTSLALRGKPSSGVKRWLQLDGGRPGVAPGNDRLGPDLPAVLADVGVGSITISYDEPTDPDWKTTEVYLATSSFTANFGAGRPDPSLLVAVGRQSRFDITGLVPGSQVFVRVVVVDVKGNFFIAADIVDNVPEKVGVFHENSDSIRQNLVPNGDFGHTTKDVSLVPPDGWEMVARPPSAVGVWGTDAVADTAVQQTGSRSIRFPATPLDHVQMRSRLFAVEPEVLYKIAGLARFDLNTADVDAGIGYFQFDKDKAQIGAHISVEQVRAVDVNANEFVYFEDYLYFDFLEPNNSGVAFAKAAITKQDDFTNVTTVWFDRIVVNRAKQAFETYLDGGSHPGGNQAAAPDVFVPIQHDFQVFDIGEALGVGGVDYGIGSAGADRGIYRTLQPGPYSFEACVGMTMTAGRRLAIAIGVNGTIVKVGNNITAPSTTDIQVHVSHTVDLLKGDTVQAFVFHNNPGASQDILNGRTVTWFTGARDE